MHKQFDILKTDSNISGIFRQIQAAQVIGSIKKDWPCILLSGENDFIRFVCPENSDSDVWVLELDELHQKVDQPFSYQILINDAPAYLRTMEPESDTLCPCFVKLRLQAGDSITIRSNAAAPIRFTDIFLHSDLKAIQASYDEPMEIGLCFPRFTYSDHSADLALMCKIRDDFADLKHFTIAIGVEVKYMLLSDVQLKDQFDYIINLAARAGVNLIFNFNSWWDGTPDGRDGKGGYFSDMEYQQVVYDSRTGKKLLSIPNLWRNTPWYTMNHDHLNMVRKKRLACTLDILGQKTAKLRCENNRIPNIRLFIDNEPTYWAEFAYTASPESGGDFNEHCIAAAAKDGVDLEPHGSLTHEQKEWLVHNHCTYMTDLSEAYHTQTSREYGVVTAGHTIYTNHYLAENTFTHIMPYTGYPYADGGHLRYEEHVNPWVRLGVECNGFQDERVLSYMNATGRYAQVNAERCCYVTSDFHQQFYAHGAVCDIIFNYFYDADRQDLHALDDLDDLVMPQLTYGTPVMSWRGYDGALTGGQIIAKQNMEIAPLRERRVLRPANLGKGFITFSIGNISDYPHGGWLELTGLIRPANGKVTLSVGTASDSFSLVMELPDRDVDYLEIPLRVPLTEVLAVNSDLQTDLTLYMRLDFENLYYDDWAQMNGIWKIRSVAAFPDLKDASALLPAQPSALPLTLREARALSLMVSYRTDCNRLMKDDSLSEHDHLIHDVSAADFKTLYGQLMHEISVKNTDKFVICGDGFLEKYDLHVASGSSTITLTLEQQNGNISATLSGAAGSQLTLRAKASALQAEQIGSNRYKLTKSSTVAENPPAAEQTVTLTVAEPPCVPGSFTGTFLGYDREHQQIKVTTHDTPSRNWQSSMQFVCEESVPVTLTASPLAGDMLKHISSNPYTPAALRNAKLEDNPSVSSLSKGDAVIMTMLGEKVTEIRAVRGIARGKIVDIVPISLSAPMHNAFLTIETAPGIRATFELGMKTHLNYKRAHAENPLLAGDLDLELKKDCIVLVSFEPESVKDNCYRALEVTLV